MQIEKPQQTLSRRALFFGVVVGLLILSLPFFARPSKSSHLSEVQAKTIVPESQTNEIERTDSVANAESKTSESVPPKILAPEKVAAVAEIQKAETPFPDAPPAAVDLPEKVEVVQPSKDPVKVESTTPSIFKNQPPAIMTSFRGDVTVLGADGVKKAAKNRQIMPGETIEVGASGEAVVEVAELYILRLKQNTKITQLEAKSDKTFSGANDRLTHRLKLEKGSVLGTTKTRGDKIDLLDLLVHDKVFHVQDSTFRIQLSDAQPWIGVLRGNVKANVENVSTQKPVVIRALEKIPLSDVGKVTEPVKVSKEEWDLLRETYDMNVKTAAEEAQQVDLSKKAGDFFQFVFDHGNFFTENVGYTVRDFYQDKASGQVYLEAEYDVFPPESFVGLYVLTRDLDARDYGGIKFDVRRKPDEGYPDRFYVEVKSRGQIIHRFEITDIKPKWEGRQIEFFTPASTPITEVTFVFLNQTIGQTKKGFVQLKNFQMLPLTPEQKANRAVAESKPKQNSKKTPRLLPQAPQSMKQAKVTLPTRDDDTESASPIPYKTDTSKKIANEVPKVVDLGDFSN